MDDHPLDNIIWHALGGPQARFDVGAGPVRRYDPEVALFAATERVDQLGALAAAVPAGARTIHFTTAPFDVPAEFETIRSAPLLQMAVSAALAPPPGMAIRRLGTADLPAVLELVDLTQPGPFARRTMELGSYLGIFDADRLVAMTGERLRLAGYTEISAVCTHPEYRGRGYAKALIAAVAEGIFGRGEVPFLEVWPDNLPAIATYESLGFAPRRMLHATLLKRRPEAD